MAKCRSNAEKFSADRMMMQTASSLVRDFQNNFLDPGFCADYHTVLRSGNVARIREAVPAPTNEMSVAEFKATYQIASVMKRYRFETDTYSEAELIIKAVDSFRDTQSRLADLDLDGLSASSQLILDLAANYVAKVLGPYSDEEHRSLCRFGKRASVGIPASAACEAARWELPITGSPGQISWFDSEMSEICCVQEYWAKQKGSDPNRSTYQETSSLKLTLVPKTFKSLRSIMPNTTIGSYMSYGIGEMIRKRLKRVGYDIRSLQQRHKVLARAASLHGQYVTADLSSASDSISVALVDRLLPRDWLEVLHQSRIAGVILPDGSEVESLTFCTMGVGYTFPLQTLVFLALLKAIESALFSSRDRRTISVYGDDMIYHVRMHKHVVFYLQQFGFVINIDKTYHDGWFRESCGGDYYHGVDVRPFQPRNGSAFVGKKAYEALLYKCVNGLLARWEEHEIGKTLDYLTSEIEALVGKCKLVPQHYPDDSGIKCPSLMHWDFLKRARCAKPKNVGSGMYRFSFLRFLSDVREEVRHEPYLWVALSGDRRDYYDYSQHDHLGGPRSREALLIERATGIEDERESLLITREVKPIRYVRSCLTGRRQRRKASFVTIGNRGKYTRQQGVSCFETRG